LGVLGVAKKAQNTNQSPVQAQKRIQGQTAVDSTTNYSENAQNPKQSLTDNFPKLYITIQYPQANYSRKTRIQIKARFKP
jgi:hypothetical protein